MVVEKGGTGWSHHVLTRLTREVAPQSVLVVRVVEIVYHAEGEIDWFLEGYG
jgi:hypothetical protein